MKLSTLDILLLVASLISALLVSSSIIIHSILPKLRRSPGQFLLMMQFSQLIIDLTLIFSILLPSSDEPIQEHCELFSSIFTLNISFSILTSLCLKCEIFLQVRARVSTSYTKRNKFYYFLIVFFSAMVFLIIYNTNSLGQDEFSYCSIKKDSFGEYFVYGFIMTDVLCLWLLIIYVKILIKASLSGSLQKFMNLIFLTSVIISALVIILIVNMFYHLEVLKILASVFLLTAVNLATIYRVLDPSVLRELKWKLFKERMRKGKRIDFSLVSSRSSSNLLIPIKNEGIDMRESLEIKDIQVRNMQNLLKVLICLTLRFEGRHTECETNQGKSIYFFSEDLFFQVFEKYEVSGIENSKKHLVYDPNLGIIEYQPEIFEDIRRRNGINNQNLTHTFFTKENINSVKMLKGVLGGKSGSYLICTENQLFVIKIVSDREINNLLQILPFYSRRIRNSSSRLVKIFGAFKILPEKVNVLIMQNLIRDRGKHVIFDLKGSLFDRSVAIGKFPVPGIVLKDLNFIENKVKVILRAENERLLAGLKRDFEVLHNCNIIDYSLILAVPIKKFQANNEVVFDGKMVLGIIDFLQNYNFIKKTEKKIKALCRQKDFSITDPWEYYTRISKFLNEIFEIRLS